MLWDITEDLFIHHIFKYISITDIFELCGFHPNLACLCSDNNIEKIFRVKYPDVYTFMLKLKINLDYTTMLFDLDKFNYRCYDNIPPLPILVLRNTIYLDKIWRFYYLYNKLKRIGIDFSIYNDICLYDAIKYKSVEIIRMLLGLTGDQILVLYTGVDSHIKQYLRNIIYTSKKDIIIMNMLYDAYIKHGHKKYIIENTDIAAWALKNKQYHMSRNWLLS